MSDVRLTTERYRYSTAQRFMVWWRGVIEAIREIPDTHYSEFIRLEKGDPGYEKAPYSVVEYPNPARFTFKNGQYVPSEQ